MSISFGCRCTPKNKKNWRVIHRHHNHSHFETPKGGEHYSDYSSVCCLVCEMIGRTKAKYVDEVEDGCFDRYGKCVNSKKNSNVVKQ